MTHSTQAISPLRQRMIDDMTLRNGVNYPSEKTPDQPDGPDALDANVCTARPVGW